MAVKRVDHAAFVKSVMRPEVKELYKSRGFLPTPSTHEELASVIVAETPRRAVCRVGVGKERERG